MTTTRPHRRSRCACICARWASVELLSREGEIAIAKRIEAGRDMMIGGICESPLTFQRHRRLARRAPRRARCCCATSSISKPPTTAPDGQGGAAADAGRATSAVEARQPRRGRRWPTRRRGEGERSETSEEGEGTRALARRHGGGAQARGARHLRRDRRPYKKLHKLQDHRLETMTGEELTASRERELREAPRRDRRATCKQRARCTTTASRSLVEQLYGINRG